MGIYAVYQTQNLNLWKTKSKAFRIFTTAIAETSPPTLNVTPPSTATT